MNTLFKRSLLAVALLCATVLAHAQIDEQVYTIDGKKYFMHTVEQGNTLFAISQKYGVEILDIVEANPEVKNGLRIGANVKVPVNEVKESASRVKPPRVEGDHIYHTVVRGETMYFLSKRYEISIEDLVASNPELKEGLKLNQELRIPVKHTEPDEHIGKLSADNDSLIKHVVGFKQTLYAIAQQYRTTVDSLKMVNPGLTNDIKPGQFIRVPRLRKKSNLKVDPPKKPMPGQVYVDTIPVKN